jgi:DNA-binding transcriptional ArsR family regulator
VEDQALRAIAEPRRREILRVVFDGEVAATDIARRFPDVTGPAISQHLRVLVDAGLVTVRKEGRRRWYRARPEGLRGLREYLEGFWRTALEGLAEEAEAEERRQRYGTDPEGS